MDERAFDNTFEDYSVEGASFITSEKKLSAAYLEKVDQKVQKLLSKLEKGLERVDFQDYSVYTGTGGIAYLYMHLKSIYRNDDYMKKALNYFPPMNYFKQKRLSFLCGDAGPLALCAVACDEREEKERSSDCIKRVLSLHGDVMRDSQLPDELLFGRTGYLWALLYLQKKLGDEVVSHSLTNELYEKILESGRKMAKKEKSNCPLMYQWHDKKYLGAAHGLAGILYVLMQFKSEKHKKNLHELIRPTLDYLITLKFPSGNFPSSMGSSSGDKLVHWCHGAPGWIYTLLRAYKVFQDDTYMSLALECGEVIWSRGLLKKGYGLCHGVAGNGYAFLALFRATSDPKHLYRAAKFADWCMEYGTHGCQTPDRPMSLFEGLAGTIYFLSDLQKPDRAKFPAFVL